MKKKLRVLALFMVMALTFTCVPVQAAPKMNFSYSKSITQRSWWEDIWNKLTGKGNENHKDENNSTSSVDLKLLEDKSTVDNGDMLRASTYAMTPKASARAAMPELKYFPVTMYNYDENVINKATHDKEMAAGPVKRWEGMYFNNGAPGTHGIGTFHIPDGRYYIVNARATENKVPAYLYGNYKAITGRNQADTHLWDIKKNADGTYQVKKVSKSASYVYMKIDAGIAGVKLATTNQSIKIDPFTGSTYENAVTFGQNSQYLCQFGSSTATEYGGYNVAADGGAAFYLYDQNGNKINTGYLGSYSFAEWNHWRKSSHGESGKHIYSGLVHETLSTDRNKSLTFTKPDGGIFDANSKVKKIYTNVEMPFTYDSNTKMYEFDAAKNGVYFNADTTQQSTAAQSNGRLFFDATGAQTASGVNTASGGTVWMPFNSKKAMDGSECDYHFGMKATIPFSMTSNGRIYETDDTSDPITFEFNGDDDVWVFIDGQLVLDIGGIHDRLQAKIDFANNTWEIFNTQDANPNPSRQALSGSVFNTETAQGTLNTVGTLNTTRETFAAKTSHELTIFYLERGKGSSNCKINFNLPMKDYVTVTKHMDKSKTKNGVISPMTPEEKETYQNTPFGFTLKKDGQPVAHTKYQLISMQGQLLATPSTDAKGHFTLLTGQSARFIGEIPAQGARYQVVEDPVAHLGCSLPTYTYSGKAAGGYDVSNVHYTTGAEIPKTDAHDDKNLISSDVTVKGSLEAEDSLRIICENYLDAELPNPSCRPVDDEIVIDYGLPVEIDVLANDGWRGTSRELISVTGAKYGKASVVNGKVQYQLTEQLTGVEVLTYTTKVTGTGNSGNQTTTATETKDAKVYIMPATTMYYEENFDGLVTTPKGTWRQEGTPDPDFQESGIVGDIKDSPYGSDQAYLNDSKDSNGTSKYVSTATTAGQFTYTFTGEGTTFFARTTNNTGCMKITITDASGAKVDEAIRNTEYTTTDSNLTMYNIPVYTWNAEVYGTYTVTVSLANKKLAPQYGSDFWLDGIRVYKPLNTSDVNASRVLSAYARDEEDECTVVTLREKLIAESMVDSATGELEWAEQDQATNKFVVFTDTNGQIVNASEYVSHGPKEEMYLDAGQSVHFGLQSWNQNKYELYLGMKAPKGTAKVQINNHIITLNNATDCYYKISDYVDMIGPDGRVEIKAISGLVSITNIKATGSPQFTLVTPPDINVDGNVNGDGSSDIVISNDTTVEQAPAVEEHPVVPENTQNGDAVAPEENVQQETPAVPEESVKQETPTVSEATPQ